MIPGLGRAHLFFGSHKRGVQAAWYKVVSLVFIVFVWFYNCQLFWSNLVMNSQMFANWYDWQTGTEISTKSRFSNGFPGRMENSSKCRNIIFFYWKFQLGAKTSDNWRSDQSNSCEKQVIMVCEWYCEIHRGASCTHPIFITKKENDLHTFWVAGP